LMRAIIKVGFGKDSSISRGHLGKDLMKILNGEIGIQVNLELQRFREFEAKSFK
jgi:hypothetical protein